MRNKTIAILLVMVIAAAVAVSGCTGGNASVDPSTSPGTTTKPTANANEPDMPEITLKDNGNFNWAEYSMKSDPDDDKPTKIRYEMSQEDYEGTPAKHLKMIMEMMGMEIVSDVYISTATGKAIAAKVTGMGIETIVDEQNLSTYDTANPASTLDAYTNADGGYSSYVYKGATPDVVIINGHTYTCTKYTFWKSYSDDGSSRMEVWIDPNVPLPVMTQEYYKNEKDDSIELLGWG